MIDLAALESLRAVAHHASVNGAAQALGFTPSAVSQQVKRLERTVTALHRRSMDSSPAVQALLAALVGAAGEHRASGAATSPA